MYAQELNNLFEEREPILRDELKNILQIENENSFNQALSNMVLFGLIKRVENGIYYIQSSNKKFKNLKPSLNDIIYKKYLKDNAGFRSGAYLLYKYKLTSQVSEYYEVLSNNVSSSTRSKKEYNGKAIISAPKFHINKENIRYMEFLEIMKQIDSSDYNFNESIEKLSNLFLEMKLDKDLLIMYSNYYKGNRFINLRNNIKGVIDYETA
ncbi:MAG: hypothetical protein K8Q99_04970 [Acholeplasmataceae bacterium]|nr:hypothetical protein [Acholeplasmataceae bacterium]